MCPVIMFYHLTSSTGSNSNSLWQLKFQFKINIFHIGKNPKETRQKTVQPYQKTCNLLKNPCPVEKKPTNNQTLKLLTINSNTIQSELNMLILQTVTCRWTAINFSKILQAGTKIRHHTAKDPRMLNNWYVQFK